MAFVTKCDICGEIYKSSKEPQTAKIRFDGHLFADLDNNQVDCCPECTKKLTNFVDILKTGRNYCIYIEE